MRLLVVMLCLTFSPTAALAERASIEIGGGLGATSTKLSRGIDDIGTSDTPLWRFRGQLTVPLSQGLSGLLSYQRIGDTSGPLAYIEGSGGKVFRRTRVSFFEVGFRIGL